MDEARGVDAEAVHVQHGDEEGERLQNSQRAVDEDEVSVGALGRRLVRAARGRNKTVALPLLLLCRTV